jgi:tetratricopeptide (TPR) repeat protein
MAIKHIIFFLLIVAIYISEVSGEETVEELVNKGMKSFYMGTYPAAKESFDAAISLNSSSPEAWRGLGCALNGLAQKQTVSAAEKSYYEAIECFEKALQLNPNYAEAFMDMAWSYYKLQDYGTAEEKIDIALKINPNLPDAYNIKGKIFFDMFKYYDAIKCYKNALQIDSDNSNAYWNMGDALEMIGDEKGADEARAKAIEIDRAHGLEV